MIKKILISISLSFILFSPLYAEQSKPLSTPPNELLYGKNYDAHKNAHSAQIKSNDIIIKPTEAPKNNTFVNNTKTIPVKKTSNGLLVREDVFNDLVTKAKLYEQVLVERDYYKNKAVEILALNLEQTTIYEQRLKLKDEIILTKEAQIDLYKMNTDNYKLIIEDKNLQLTKLKRNNFIKDILTLGLTAYGISQMDDNSSKAIIGAAGLLNIYIK